MSDFILLLLIIVLLLCLVVTVVGLLVYSGLLSDVEIKTGPPPVRNVTIAYKFKEGSYKDCGAAFTESCSIGPKLDSIGVFYDDPRQVRPAAVLFNYSRPHDMTRRTLFPDKMLQFVGICALFDLDKSQV